MNTTESQNAFPEKTAARRDWIIVGVMMLVYTMVFSYASILRYASFNGTLFDLGIMIQTLYNTSHGHLLVESVNLGTPVTRFWLAHWEFIYLPLALIYKIVPRPETILVLQTAFLALGALPVYLLAKYRLWNRPFALVLAAAYLLYPAMQNANLFDVHGQVFAIPFILFAFYFLERDNKTGFWISAVLALMCREDVAVVMTMLGLYIAVFRRNFKLGLSLAALSVFWFGMFYFGRLWAIDLFNLQHLLEVGEDSARISHWAYLQGGKLILQRPLYFLDEHLLTGLNLRYLFWLLFPLAFLSLASPWTLAIASPILLINMTSDWLPTHLIEYQYTATITPFVFIAAILGLVNLVKFYRRNIVKDGGGVFLSKVLRAAVLIFALYATYAMSNVRKIKDWQRTAHHEAIDRVIARIPADASLSVDTIAGSHAAERLELYAFPDQAERADYILYDFGTPEVRLMSRNSYMLPAAKHINEIILGMLRDPRLGVVKYDDGVVLLQRGADQARGLSELCVAPPGEIRKPLDVALDGGVRLLGYTEHDAVQYKDSTYAHLTLYWSKADSAAPEMPAEFFVDSGGVTTSMLSNPGFGLYPVAAWQPGEIIREEVYWPKGPDGAVTEVSVMVEGEAAREARKVLEF